MACSICGSNEEVYGFPVQISISRRQKKSKMLCNHCFNNYILDKAFSQFDKLELHSPKKIFVAYSGECDSAFLLVLLQKYKRLREVQFTIYPVLVCPNSSATSISRVKAAQQLTRSLELPLYVLHAKDILGMDCDEYFEVMQSQYDLNKFIRCKICSDIRDILLFSARKALSFDFMVTGRNKDDLLSDFILQLITPPHEIYISHESAFLSHPIQEFTDKEIRLYIELNSIPNSLKRCVYERIMPRREINNWINQGENKVFELRTRLYSAMDSVSKDQPKLSYAECPYCGFPYVVGNYCSGCKLFMRYNLNSEEICQRILDNLKAREDYL